MNKIKKNQQGFGLIEWLLILFIIMVLIAVGWFVVKSKNNTEQSQQNEANAQSDPGKNSAKAVKDETEDWLLYSPPGKEYQLRVPDGWELERYSTSSGIYSPSGATDIVYKKGTKATVTQVEGGRDFSSIAFSLGYIKNTELSAPGGTKQPDTLTTKKQNITISKYKQAITEDPEIMGPPKGTTEFTYRITKGDYTVYIVHDIAPGEADQTTYIEKALLTLEFL